MSNPTGAGNHCVIIVADLFAKINAQRKLLTRTPIEDRAMASRCTLRFNIDKQRGVDFSAEKILIEPDEIELLEKMVNELFGIYFDGEVRRMCVKPEAPPSKPANLDSYIPETSTQMTIEPEKTGLLSRLKGLFGGK
jgi:hypothetical protein